MARRYISIVSLNGKEEWLVDLYLLCVPNGNEEFLVENGKEEARRFISIVCP